MYIKNILIETMFFYNVHCTSMGVFMYELFYDKYIIWGLPLLKYLNGEMVVLWRGGVPTYPETHNLRPLATPTLVEGL